MQNQKIISIDSSDASGVRLFDGPAQDVFRDNTLLAGINEEAYAQIAAKTQVVQYSPREIIFDENDPGEALYLIAQGSVKISKKGRGGQQETLTYLMERDFFGEMALIDNGIRSAQAAAVGHTVLGRMDRATWDLLLRVAPHEVLSNFTKAVTRRLRANNQHFIEEMMRNERLTLLGTTISSIVHDMNNPIACILGACELMQAKLNNQVADQMAGMIRDSVDKMESMTRELLDFSRGNTQLNLQTITMGDLLQSIESDFAKCRPRIEVEVDASYHGELRIDKHRLQRVFGNLIRNARDAMKKSSTKVLRFTAEKVDSNIRFEISDTGCGIPAQILPRIFEPFMTHGKANGTGLGLAISKAVVEAHRGTVNVASSEKGTSFQIDLPLES